MNFIDLFAGIGGFHYGLEKTKGFKCVWANEFNKYASKIYKKRFPKTDLSTVDIRTIDPKQIPRFDLLVGGFPCQAFSIAGKRKGFDDTRGTLFFEIAKIIKQKRPKVVLLENVKGLLNHDRGRTFSTIIRTLDDLGYWVEWQVLNSKNFGVPQNRERVFIVGHLRGGRSKQIFPIRQAGEKFNERNTEKQIASALQHPGHSGGNYRGMNMVQRTPLKFLQRNQKNFDGKHSFTVDPKHTGGVKVQEGIRRLTPIECERLQGFPDNWTEGLSDTQRYKCLGNAVTTNVITAIGKRIKENN